MKRKAIQILLALFPVLLFAQDKAVQKLINGKPCDTCFVKYNLSYSNVLPYVFIGAMATPQRLYQEYRAFKDSIPEQPFEQNVFLITDSILNVVFLTGEDKNTDLPNAAFKWDKNYDYKEIEIGIEKNKAQYKNWQTLSDLKPIRDYRINRIRYSEKTQEYIIEKWSGSHQTGEIHFSYNDIVEITLRQKKSKKILRRFIIKRQLDRPVNFCYLQSEINSSNAKKVIRDFLDLQLNKMNFKCGDSATHFELKKGNIGMLFFKSLEAGEEVEYSFTGTVDWQPIQRVQDALWEGALLLLDQEEVPPGKTQSIYLRYKGQPGSIYKIEIQGRTNITQTSFFKVTAGFMLALLLFTGWYVLKRRLHKKQIAALNRKNKDIETRLSLLSGQLNPHFLFNSLHAIQGSINSNNIHEANNYIADIARFMRNSMDYSKREFVSLAEELYLEADYLQLEQRRKYFTFDLVIDKNIDASQIDFPPLLLQPVLENSVRHAFGKHANPVLYIEVSGHNHNLLVAITDNGEGWNSKEKVEGHGLGLVRKRIELINEKMLNMRIYMNIRSIKGEGTVTTFTFENWLI